MIWGEKSESHLLYQSPLSWFWLTQGWVLQPQHCFWPKLETHTPPRHSGPLRWLSVCSHRLSRGLEKNRKHTAEYTYAYKKNGRNRRNKSIHNCKIIAKDEKDNVNAITMNVRWAFALSLAWQRSATELENRPCFTCLPYLAVVRQNLKILK